MSPKVTLREHNSRIPGRVLLHVTHHCKCNEFTIEQFLVAEKGNFKVNTLGIGIRTQDGNRSYKRGTPGNISLVADALRISKGTDNFVYYIPESIFLGIRSLAITIKLTNTQIEITAPLKLAETIKRFFNRKTVHAKLRYGASQKTLIFNLASRGDVETKYFEQRKKYYSVVKNGTTENFVLPFAFWSYESIEKDNSDVSYYIPKSYMTHTSQPNLVVMEFEGFKFKKYYTIPFEIWRGILEKNNPNAADRYIFTIKDGKLIFTNTQTDLLPYLGFKEVKGTRDTTIPLSKQTQDLAVYRTTLHTKTTSSLDSRIESIKNLGEVTLEMNLMFHISVLSLAGLLSSKQGTILTLKLDSAYPDILAIFIESIPDDIKLEYPNLASLRDHVLKNIKHYANNIIEIEAELDISGFDTHTKGKDDLRRTKIIILWNNPLTKKVYRENTIEIVSIKPLWDSYISGLSKKGYP